MNRIVYIVLSFLIACACSGTSDMSAVYTISVDKDVIEADGKDRAVFTITDADGNVMTTTANMRKIYFKNVATGFNLEKGTDAFTSIANGEFEFVGMCMGVKTVNAVKIKVQNRRKYELYHRNVGLFKCTSVWCSMCPELSATLHALDSDSAEHSVILSCHGKFDGKTDPLAIKVGETNDIGNMMLDAFEGSGWPTLVYDLDYGKTGAGVTRAELAENIMERRLAHPATCGVKVNSSVVEDGFMKVSASMKTSAAGNYDLTCAVIEDGCYYVSGSYSVGGKGIFDDVLVAVQPNFLSYSTETGKYFDIDEELTKEFVFDLNGTELTEERLERTSIVVFAHRRPEGRDSVMDNIVSVLFGQSSEYILND